MFRTHWIVVLTLALLAIPRAEQAVADTPLDAGVIKAALKTAQPEDQGFVDRVVAMANKGTLPPGLVETTFLWAQKKPVKFRYQYFRRALILRANALGVTGLATKSSQTTSSSATASAGQ